MPPKPEKIRQWYQKKRYIIPLAVLAVVFVLVSLGGTSNQTASVQTSAAAINSLNLSSVSSATQSQPVSPQNTALSNDNYYTNSSGNQVHSPAYAPSVPVGATAQCGDGTYSFSQHRSGTCSHHGGVNRWL